MLEIALAVAALSLLILVHEAGHFLAARATGMRVLEFSIGVGPAIVTFRSPRGDTTYALRAIPFAAYVRIAGVTPAADDAPEDRALYHRKGVGARALVNAAGPLANYLAASAMIFGLAVTGWPTPVPSAQQPERYVLVNQPLSAGEALEKALLLPAKHTALQLSGISSMLARGDTEGLTGPVGMGRIVADQAAQGTTALVSVMILISIALGLFNLLPFPGLDGGKLVFLGYEAITRRRPSPRIELLVHGSGLLFLLGVVALVTLRDVLG